MNKIDKKTILILSCFYTPFEGGAERYVKEITQRLKEKYNFLILTSWLSRKTPKKEIKDEIEIFRLGLGFQFDKYLYPILAPFKSFFISHDILHAVLESYAGLALLIYKIFNKKTPTLLTLQTGRVSIPYFLFKKIHQVPDKIQAISNTLAERAKKFGAKNVEVVPNGVTLNKFKIRNSKFKMKGKLGLKDQFVIMTIARLEKVKGIEYLIEAMEILNSKFKIQPQPISNGLGQNSKLFIIGDGSERKKLENLVENLNLQEKVKFFGQILNEKIPEFLASANCFVLPSVSEGFGIVILEAMAAGVPVIATNVGGIPDIIENGKNGILVEPKNPEAIVKAIIKIFSDSQFAQKLVQNANANLTRYDWDNIAQKINLIYQELLK